MITQSFVSYRFFTNLSRWAGLSRALWHRRCNALFSGWCRFQRSASPPVFPSVAIEKRSRAGDRENDAIPEVFCML